jgi:LAGLIDADG endonuclease
MGRAIGGTAEKVRAIAEAQGLDDFDGHALAGFIEAEGSFFIQPNNGGRSWVCGMTLTQRADDADMLVDIARVTGLGRLHSLAAQRKSRPQVCWSVASKRESRELARLLRQYPLRGRKRHELWVWARAVDEWTQTLYGRGDARGDRLMRSCRRAPSSSALCRPALRPRVTSGGPRCSRRIDRIPGRLLHGRRYVRLERSGVGVYELARSRHPEWPTRNTITLAFGSWAEALRAAGLGSRGSDWAHRRGSPRLVGAP